MPGTTFCTGDIVVIKKKKTNKKEFLTFGGFKNLIKTNTIPYFIEFIVQTVIN